MDGLTFEGYRNFRKLCDGEEWDRYEPKLMKNLPKIRRVMVDVLDDSDRWNRYKAEILRKTERRPAFHEEAAERIADWKPE